MSNADRMQRSDLPLTQASRCASHACGRFGLIARSPLYHALTLVIVLIFAPGCGRVEVGADATSSKAKGGVRRPDGRMNGRAQLLAETGGEAFDTEAYHSLPENDFLSALEQPQSTFSIDVDTASYANVRRLLKSGKKPPRGAVRIEELVNYFSYDYSAPSGGHPFSVDLEYGVCPWQPENHLLRVGMRAKSIDFSQRAPCNLVFLLDVSGSMMSGDKLPLVQKAMKLLAEELLPTDRIAIVVYAGASGLVLDSTEVRKAGAIVDAIDSLKAGGSTNGGAGIELAYSVAEANLLPAGINRVVLCTDGDFNVGATSESALVDLVQQKAKSDVFLSVLGFGSGNLKDSTMEKLADKGNGNYAYIDSLLEARKVLIEEVGGTLVTVAKDVKIQLDFNPAFVDSYRLIGYENRLLNNQDFRDDAKDAGEIGAGHRVTAFYEIRPASSESSESQADDTSIRASEFVAKTVVDNPEREQTCMTVNLRYKQPAESESTEFQVRVPATEPTALPSSEFQFAAAVAGYGLLLRGSQYGGQANWDWVIQTAERNRGSDPRGLRSEFVELAKLARRLDP